MTMDHNLSIDSKMLRNFGITSAAIVILLLGLLIPWLRGSGWPLWPWVLSGSILLAALIMPGTLGPVFRVWMKFGHIMNKVNTTIILTVVFFVVFTPVGLFMKLISRDVLHRKFDQEAESYRITSDQTETKKMERPF